MTQEEIIKVNGIATELIKELWGSEHLECRGNLEVKLQSIVEKLIIHTVSNCECGSKYYHTYKCVNTNCNNCIIYKTSFTKHR